MTDRKDLRVREKEHTWIGGETMAFRVGENLITFHVHKDLLKTRGIDLISFAQCNWLREDRPSTFKLYMQHIYTGNIPSKAEGNTTSDRCEEFSKLFHLFFLAERLNDVGAMDAVVSAVLALSTEPTSDGNSGVLPGRDQISYVYRRTDHGALLRRLMVDLYVWSLKDTSPTTLFEYFQESNETSKQFLLDLSKAVMEKYAALQEKVKMPDEMDQASCCDYHQHKKDAPCSSRKRKRGDNEEATRDPKAHQPATAQSKNCRTVSLRESDILD